MAQKFTREDFLDALFYDYLKTFDGFVAVRSFGHVESKVSTRFFPNIDILSRERYPEDVQVFFGVCPRNRMKPGKEHVQHLTALWASLDVGPGGYSGKERHFTSRKQALAAIKDFPRQPSAIVPSGSGIHLYWLLQGYHEIKDFARIEKILKEINQYFQCTAQVEVDSFMRLPGTKNLKVASNSSPCYVEHIDAGLKYSLTDFEGLDLRIVLPSKRPPKPIQVPQPDAKKVTFLRDKVKQMEAEAKLSSTTDVSASPSPAPGKVPGSPTPASPAAPSTTGQQTGGPLANRSTVPATATKGINADAPGNFDNSITLSDESIRKLSEQLSEDLGDKVAEKVADKLWDRFFKNKG